MRLRRNIDGREKYGIIRNDLIPHDSAGAIPYQVSLALRVLDEAGLLAESGYGAKGEAFVIMLKDMHAPDALNAYADAAEAAGDPEFATDVRELAGRSGSMSPHAKYPDPHPAPAANMGWLEETIVGLLRQQHEAGLCPEDLEIVLAAAGGVVADLGAKGD